MTEQVTGAIKHAVMGHGNDKIDQLKANIVEPSENTRITSDYGVKQNNTDHWLRVNSEDQTGASLLEDAFGREKVCYSIYGSFRFCSTLENLDTDGVSRFIASTTSVFLSALSTPAVLVPTAHSSYSNLRKMSPKPAYLPTQQERLPYLFDSQLFWEAAAPLIPFAMSVGLR
jgi:hypothetical protein